MKILAITALLAFSAAPAQEGFEPTQPGEQHAWLEQLLGDWTATCTAEQGPDVEPMKIEGTESVRSIGGLWIVTEGKADMFGQPMMSQMTLGYDPKEKAFVGTWVDSMHAYLWIYRGTLDAGKKVLTLETDGPNFEDPTKKTKFRDVITVVSEDVRTLDSSMQGADGKWTKIMHADYKRQAAKAGAPKAK